MNLFRGEVVDRSLHYYFLAPVRREVLVVGKYLSGLIATIALFTAVGYWNDYFSSVLYINTKSRWSLQAVLRYMLTNPNPAMQSAGVTVTATTNVMAATIKAASVVVATVPILCVYPFVQKYFVKGVMIGGVKG